MRKKRLTRVNRVVAVGAAFVLGASALSACTIDRDGNAAESEGGAESKEVSDDPAVISVDDGDTDVEPGTPVTVTSDAGLDTVTMKNEEGKEVESKFNDDKTEWTSNEPLGYGREYTVEATTTHGTKSSSTFTTVVPAAQMSASLGPLEGSEVGVAQAISFYFDVAPTDRKAVEEAITVETSNDTEGAFFWLDPNQLRWRPKEFWEPGTEVSVKADLYGKEFGDGIYGADDNATSFTVGDEVKTVVDNNTKTMTVYRNGEEVKSMPVSLGTDGSFDTPNGMYVVGDQSEYLVMDSTTYGLSLEAGGYVTPVNYATQLSWSGIYVHGAPWAVGALGSYNQSHGCINVTDADAQWYMNYVKPGDPVEVKNTAGPELTGYDGLGYWNIDWETWKKGNADE